MGINLLAALWGLAEATVFFIVPDVWLSIVGRNKLRIGLIACLYSLIGAMIGGLLMFSWGSNDQAAANQLLDKIPAISPVMINDVNRQLKEQGLIAVLFGPLNGTPYKIYAVQAAGQGLSLWAFMLVTIPARLIRFMLVTTFFHYALKGLNRVINTQHNLRIVIISWIGFYLLYFSLKGL